MFLITFKICNKQNIYKCMFEGFAYAMATSGGSGGCTTTGEASRKMYGSLELRERLVQHSPEDNRVLIRKILTNSK
jgi:hypothetical protein